MGILRGSMNVERGVRREKLDEVCMMYCAIQNQIYICTYILALGNHLHFYVM